MFVRRHQQNAGFRRFQMKVKFPRRRPFRIFIACLAFIALLPPLFLHFRLSSLHQAQLRRCAWLRDPPLVCAHGGDTTEAFANTMAAFHAALHSQVDCIEIDVSRSSDGILLALHDRDLQRITGDRTSRVGHLTSREIKELKPIHQYTEKFVDVTVTTLEQALMFISKSVHQVILDAKIGPPSFEDGLAEDILSVVVKTACTNCLVWAKSDTLIRDVIKLSSNLSVGYIVMKEPSTRGRTNLLRVKGAGVAGVYHPLIDKKLMSILHGSRKKVYAWTVDDVKSMQRVMFERVDGIVTSNPTLLQQLMQRIKSQCLEEGFTL
ncbi:glycerophosphodiester phosphodiesterase GDPD4 isoform X2 [Punica granatum]|uniref:glycerophosphodiester phosphodiesterase n=2 Tax=Punica granatum TaxID=22663 RepID=A0A6P8E6F4_PUNGR|nr:glycerophosphodiester phosphodiesterase GDPD4 isoform X2 [Punica granatum]